MVEKPSGDAEGDVRLIVKFVTRWQRAQEAQARAMARSLAAWPRGAGWVAKLGPGVAVDANTVLVAGQHIVPRSPPLPSSSPPPPRDNGGGIIGGGRAKGSEPKAASAAASSTAGAACASTFFALPK